MASMQAAGSEQYSVGISGINQENNIENNEINSSFLMTSYF